MGKYIFGIDVGGTSVKCGLFCEEGSLLEKWEIPTRTEENGKWILPDVSEAILGKWKERGLRKEEIIGVGVGVPGPVSRTGEVPTAVNLHWGYKDVAGELKQALGLKVKVGNDANVAALGEMWAGGGKGAENLIMVTLGTGVGGGIIVDGKIVTGAHGAGGEIGHAILEPGEAEPCNCGNHGCLEQMASATGIARLAGRRLVADSAPSVLRGERVTAKAVFDAYKAGDSVAAEIVEQFADYLGRAMAVYACVTDPEVFVIGGGVSKAGKVLIEVVEKYYMKYAFPACRAARLVLATLGNEAGIYGAAKLVMED